jgi:hypothetical protein
LEPDRRRALTFTGDAVQQGGAAVGGGETIQCFESCEQISVVNNFLKVEHAPRIERFLPEASELRAARVHRVERGLNVMHWWVVSDAGEADVRLTSSDSPGGALILPLAGRTGVYVESPTALALTAQNACGDATVTLALEPVTTVRLLPERVDMSTADLAEARAAIDAPLREDLVVALDESSGGLLALHSPTATIRAGEREARVLLRLNPRAEALGGGAQVGQITARVVSAGASVADSIVDGPDTIRIYQPIESPPRPPGRDEVLVRGRLRYRECVSEGVMPTAPGLTGALTLDAERCVLDGGLPLFKPVRRARIELWDQAPVIHHQVRVVETNDTGEFRAFVPASGFYDVTVVASSFAGQVNMQDDAITWFWKPLRMGQRGAGGSTLNFDFDFNRADARHFNALDAITRGLEYALSRTGVSPADADRTFRKTVVIPGSTSAGTTLQVGNATHIWVGAWNQIFDDEVVLHEYGHHLQHANGTYRAWGTVHNGCYATVVLGPACEGRRRGPGETDGAADVGCWVNSAELAWFEGFPAYFADVVMDFDGSRALTATTRYDFAFSPGADSCPLVTSRHFNHHNQRITGAFVEDYVHLALRDFRNGGLTDAYAGRVLTPADVDQLIFRIFFNELRDRLPTVFDFYTAPSLGTAVSSRWQSLMIGYGMCRPATSYEDIYSDVRTCGVR